jgi:SNF2 family DNA or RNA helicase
MAYDFQTPPRPSLIAALKGKKRDPVLRPFQREGVKWLAANNWNVLLADAPGAGKTPQALTAIAENRAELTPAFVTCPSSVAWNWRREAKIWAPGLSVQVVEGIHTKLREHPADITIVPWDLIACRRDALLTQGFRVVVADEAHYAKNDQSQRGEAIAALCGVTPHVILLSGTPLINTHEELGALHRLIGTPNPPMLRRLLEDVAPDIPPKRRIALDVTIPPAAMREYRRAEEEFGDYLGDIVRKEGGEEDTGKAARMMSAASLVKVGYLRRILGRAKAMSAAAWIVRQIRAGEPVVVFAEHQDVLDTLAETLDNAGVAYGRLDGSTNRKDRQKAIDGFQNGDLSVFLGSQAAREGITLHRARHALFVERWWTPAAEEQAEDRIRRIGQRHETFIWFMQVPDTYDERVAEIVEAKRALVAQHIGSATIERQDATGLLGEWLRGQPAGEADLKMPEFPPLPEGSKVHAFVFPKRNWEPSNVKRWLHIHGYKARALYVGDTHIRAELRAATGYVPGTFQRLPLGPDIGAIIGQPRRIRKVTTKRQRQRRSRRRRLLL